MNAILSKFTHAALPPSDDALARWREWVLLHPCKTVAQCGETGYRHDHSEGGIILAAVLTIDLFAPPLRWHADVSIVGPDGKCKPYSLFTVSERMAAVAFARRMVQGVGVEADQVFTRQDVCVGFTRPLTAAEVERASAAASRPFSFQQIAIGAFAEYDFKHKPSEVGPGLYIPADMEVFYGRRSH